MNYTVTVTDPKTGAVVKRGKLDTKKPLTDTQLAQLKETAAAQAKASAEAVQIAPVPAKRAAPADRPARPAAPPARVRREETPAPDTGSSIARTAMEVLPYLALPFIPGGQIAAGARGAGAVGEWLATHPKMVDAALQSLGAAGIGGGEAALRGEQVMPAAEQSGLLQLWLQGVSRAAGPIVSRLGSKGIQRVEDDMAEQIVTRTKETIPWLKGLPEGQKGIAALAQTGEAARTLSQQFGKALQAVKNDLPEGAASVLPLDDAVTLGLNPIRAVRASTPQMNQQIMVEVPSVDLIGKVSGLAKKDPELNARVLASLDQSLPDTLSADFQAARSQYKEGIQVINALRTTDAFDAVSGRLNAERLITGLRTRWGKAGEPGTSVMERTTAPKAQALLQSLSPVGERVPHGVPAKFWAHPISGHFGVGEETAKTAGKLPASTTSRVIYSDVPLTSKQEAGIRKAPSRAQAVIEALSK